MTIRALGNSFVCYITIMCDGDILFSTNIRELQAAIAAVKCLAEINMHSLVFSRLLTTALTYLQKMENHLREVLEKDNSLFNGSLGKWQGVEHKLKLNDPHCKPVSLKPYSCPIAHSCLNSSDYARFECCAISMTRNSRRCLRLS